MGTDRDPGDQNQQPPPRDPKMQLARVLLPDGVHKEFDVSKTAEGEELFSQVTRDLSIEEREYFQLCFYDKAEGTRHWLYNEKSISKQLKGLPWEFSFEVKFYPTTPTTVVDDHARYYLFLQLRRDLLTGRLPATPEIHALLGSFVAQIEFGDAPSQIADDYEKFIVGAKLVPSTLEGAETFAKIAELHRALRGQTASDAENMFLENSRQLALYGIHLYKATDKDKKAVEVGIGAAGINIYQNDEKIHSFDWKDIVKIGYKRTSFTVKLKAGILGKHEKTVEFKFPSYSAAKKTWKCAVEHHTFFRLIQPEEKQTGLLTFGSGRFRYQGRTQFQTKIASQMFDKPSTVDRAPSAMSQAIGVPEEHRLQTLNQTDAELEHRQFERYRRALTPKSYTSSRQDDDAISTATFAKYSRPSTLMVSTSYHQHQQGDLSYSPRDDSSNYSSAAYYLSERSSLRTPSSAYYPPSEYTSPTSPVFFETQNRGEYHVQMRQQQQASSGARRNLFGRASDARTSRTSQASRDSVRLVSFHEPVDPNAPIPNTYPVGELPQIPIERIVQVYHEGHYDQLSPRRQQRQELPYGFGNYTPRNGVSHVDNLEPDGEMDQQPIRFYVDVRHSGASRRHPTKRLSHPGKEDVNETLNPVNYTFQEVRSDEPIHRTELSREVPAANIQQYTRRYHHGDSTQKSEVPQYRLITHVQPLVVTHRGERESSSNLNASISQREQVVSTKIRRESPDADRRVRLSASVDRSGNVTDTTDEMARSSEQTTSRTVMETRTVEKKKTKKQKIPPTSTESRSRFGGFFTKKTSQKSSDLQGTGSEFEHRSEHQDTSVEIHGKRHADAMETSVPTKYRLIARVRHEGDEDVVEKPEAYPLSRESYEGPVEQISRRDEIQESPLATAYLHGESVKKTRSPKEASEPEQKDVRLIARIRTEPRAAEDVPVKEKKSKKGFFSRSSKSTATTAYPETSKAYTGELQSTERSQDLEASQFEHPEKKEVRLIARIRTEPDDEDVAPVKQKKPKKESSKFGFFSRTSKSTSKTSSYPETSAAFSGELQSTDRSEDLQTSPLEHHDYPAYSPKQSDESYQPSDHGDEDVVEAPAAYGFASTSYDGPLETTALERDLDHSTLGDFSTVYHHGSSWKTVASKKTKKVDVPETEDHKVRLVARVLPNEPEESKKSKLGFFKTSKSTKAAIPEYPKSTESFTGPLQTTTRTDDLENQPLEQRDSTRIISETDPVVTHEKKRYRLLARFRHEGDEDVVEKPDAYAFASDVYEGPLEDIGRQDELYQVPIGDHSAVYHHGESWRIEKPVTPAATLEKKQKKVKSPKKEKIPEPEEPEKKEVRLIARIRSEPEEEDVTEPAVTEKKAKKESSKSKRPSFGFFSRSSKSTATPIASYPETSEAYTGDLYSTARTHDLEGTSFEHPDYPAYSPKKPVADAPKEAEPEKKRYRLIARFRHEGDEDVVEKPDAYALASDVYEGPLEEISRENDLDQTPIADHSAVYHHGESWRIEKPSSPAATLEKKQKKVKSPKKEKIPEPEEPEKKEVRLIARIRMESEEPEVSAPAVTEKKAKKESSKSKLPSFGFFSRSSKTTAIPSAEDYPKPSDAYTGEMYSTKRTHDLEGTSFEHPDYPAYSPKKPVAAVVEAPKEEEPEVEKKRYRLIARFRHEGDEDVVEKPDAYALASDVYEGPLEEISRENDLDQTPIADHSAVYHHGESWRIEKQATPVATLEKKQKKVKSPKKEKIPEPEEPEKKEVRLIARIRTEPEQEESVSPVVKAEKLKKEKSKSKLSTFGFFSRKTKSTNEPEVNYPETSEAYTGDLYSTARTQDLEGTSFEHPDYPAYSPRKPVAVVVESPKETEPEKKRYRLIARFRHEGDEDVVEKPDAYAFGSDVYEGSLEDISRQDELDQVPIGDHSAVYHHGESWRVEKPATPVATLEKKQKKVKSPKKEKIPEPEEPEKQEVRLIARIKSEPEEDLPASSPAKEKKPKKESSRSRIPSFGFFHRTQEPSTSHVLSTEAYTGELEKTDRTDDIEPSAFAHPEIPAYSPKKIVQSQEVPEIHVEKKRYRLIARWRHEGEEDVVESPDFYKFNADVYEGPLEDISRQEELDQVPIGDHSQVYHHGESWRVEKPATPVTTLEKKQKKVKSPKKEKIPEPEEPEKKEVRLIARVKSEPEQEESVSPVVKEEKTKKESSRFGFFRRSSKSTATPIASYPETSEAYTGEMHSTGRTHDLEGTSFEHPDYPAYSPKKPVAAVVEAPKEAEPEKKRYRLIARFRHEGDEDVVEKPDAYAFAPTVYEGPLEEISRENDLDQTPIADHSAVYHHGESWRIEKPATPVATLEKKQKKVKSPKKEKIPEPEEPEKKEIQLIAYVKSEPEDEEASAPIVTEKKPKKESSKSKLPSLGIFRRSFRSTTKTSGYPETSEAYTGELHSVNRTPEIEGSSLEPREYPIYSPKKRSPTPEDRSVLVEKKKYRLIARYRHEGDEDEVEKPEFYQFSPEMYEGPLEDTSRLPELDQVPIGDHSAVYHHGESWRIEKPATPAATIEKKQKKVKSPKKEKISEPEEPEKKEVRLIARIRTEPKVEPSVETIVKEKKPKKESSKFGFFSRSSKTATTSSYPETSEADTGEMYSTGRTDDLEGTSFEHPDYPAYSPKKPVAAVVEKEKSPEPEKKRYRLIARFRHEGDEDVVEKPDAYAFASDVYDGPLEDISRQDELDQVPIGDHSAVYHHGESWRVEKPATIEKKQKKMKSPKKEQVVISEEPETKEVRLIAKVKSSEPEEEPVNVEEKKLHKGDSKFKLPSIGFFHRTSTSSHPETTEQYTGELNTTGRSQEIESTPFEHPEVPAYSPKVETSEAPVAHVEKKRYRLIARWRHEGEEDVVESPDFYKFNADVYEGPLEDISRQDELDQVPIGDHSAVYHHGESWRIEKPATPVATLEKKQKKVKSPKKEKIPEPEEPEKKEVRLIARIRSEPEEEDVTEPTVTEKKPKKESSKSKLPSFGFFSRSSKTTTNSSYPETSEAYTGDLHSTARTSDLEGTSFEHPDYPAYSPKKPVAEAPGEAEPEKKRYRLIARFRHEGDEDVVESPDAYAFASTVYDGPLEEISRENDLDQTPIADHSAVYHHGESWRIEKPANLEKKQKTVKSPKKEKIPEPEEPEKKEVRLIARVKSSEPQVEEPVVQSQEHLFRKKQPKKESSSLRILSKHGKATMSQGYPVLSDQYFGDMHTVARMEEMPSTSFEHHEYPAYPKKPKRVVTAVIKEKSSVPEKTKKYVLIARLKHEGEEDVVEKPDAYGFASTAYEGPMDETYRQSDIDQLPIKEHSTVYHHGESSKIESAEKPKSVKPSSPAEEESKKVRLIARILPQQRQESTINGTAEPSTSTQRGFSKNRFSSFFKFGKSTTPEKREYPEVSPVYEGSLEVTSKSDDLEKSEFEHREYPVYAPMKVVEETPVGSSVEPEKKRYRLIARWRHEGDEDVVEKPDSYAFASTVYEGPLEDIGRQDELDQVPIGDHSAVYHHGESWRIEKPATPAATLEKKQKKVKSPKKEKIPEPEEPEKKEIRLIAYVKSEPEDQESSAPTVTEKKPKKESSKLGFFSRSSKTTSTSTAEYPETSEAYTGDLYSTARIQDLEGTSFEHPDYPAYFPKKPVVEAPKEKSPEPEKKRYRLIARFRHEGDEDVVENPDAYAFASTVYDGPLEEISRENDLDQTPIADHSAVYHHGESWRIEKPATLEKKQKKVKSPKKENIPEPEEPETKEVRLIARVKSEPEEEESHTEKSRVEKRDSKSKLPTFGFFHRTSTASSHPETSEPFTGDLETTKKSLELDTTPFEHPEVPAYSPKQASVENPPVHVEKKRYRLIARWRHEGDEDVVESPDFYKFNADVYEGPLEDISRQDELDQVPIGDHSAVYHHGESWRIEKPATPVATLEKKQKVKSPKKEKIPEPEEPEAKEVRLIARIRSEPEEEDVTEPAVTETKPKKESSKSKLPSFGFFSRSSKTTTNSSYPETSEAYTGDLHSTARTHDLEGTSFEHPDYPAYSPKKPVAAVVEKEKSPESEKKRYRLIARFRHEGDEDVVEKPDAYAFASDVYDGPLEEISRENDLDQTPIADHSAVYHHGESWRIEKPANLEKKQKTVKSPKKEKIPEPEEPEKKEVRLIARVKSSEPQVEEPVVQSQEHLFRKKQPKKESSSLRILSKHGKATMSQGYPVLSDQYFGDMHTVARMEEMPSTSFEHHEYPAYPKKPKRVVTAVIKEKSSVPEKTKKYVLIARLKHEGEEDVVEKPDAYGFASTAYEGPLDETNRQADIDQLPIKEHSAVYHHGDSTIIEKPAATLEKKQKKVKSPKKEEVAVPEEPEKKEVRLIAYVKTEPQDEEVSKSIVKEKKPKKESSKFGFFSRSSKTTTTSSYPETSEAYTGEMYSTKRTDDLEGTSFEHPDYPAYSPKKPVAEIIEAPKEAEPEKKRYRLIARFRHEGDEDVVEKPDSYAFASTVYEGPLEEISRENDLDQTPIADHSAVYHHGESWRIEKPATPVATLEKKQKKVKSLKKEQSATPEEPEKKEVRLIARIRTEPEEPEVPAPAVTEKKPKKESSKSKLPSFGFFSRSSKTTAIPSAEDYPKNSDAYTGEMYSTARTQDLEGTSFEHPDYPAYSPKKPVASVVPAKEKSPEPEKKKTYRLIARFRHEGDEDVVEKPDAYAFASTVYEGPLEDVRRQDELDQVPIGDHSAVYHHGESWRVEKPATLEKKQKKMKSPKKEKTPEPEEPETKEVRLIARIRTEPEEEQPVEPVPQEKKPKKEGSKFGFFSRSSRSSKSTDMPSSPLFEGPLYSTKRSDELEPTPFEHPEVPEVEPSPEEKKPSRRFSWFARWRHEGEEDVVEKPDAYAFASTVYEGPLEDIRRQDELDQTPISDHSQVYHHGESWRVEKKKKTPEPTEVKLVARVPPMEHEESPEPAASPVKERSRSSSFNIFHRHSKQHHQESRYPEMTTVYEGHLDVTGRTEDIEKTPLETRDYPEYPSKKQLEAELPSEPPQQSRLHRLIARFRHEGEEDVVEKPDAYAFSSDVYEGPLEDIRPAGELEASKITDHSQVYHHGESWRKEKAPTSPVKLLTKIRSSEEPEESPERSEEQAPTKPLRLRFLSLGKKSPPAPVLPEYPETSPIYEGPLYHTARSDEMEQMPYLHGQVPPYSPKFSTPKKVEKETKISAPKKYRLIARFRHEGDEDVVEKPDAYAFASTVYDGPLEETSKNPEIEEAPLSNAYHHGESWRTGKKIARVPPQESSTFRFKFFSKSATKPSGGYPETSPTYEGPMEVTGRNLPIEHVPLEVREFPAYSPRKVEVPEVKRYRLIARMKHEGDEDVVEKPDAYAFASTVYEGPLEETPKNPEIQEAPLSNAYHHGESWRGVEEEKSSRFSFLRGGNKQQVPKAPEYPSDSAYSGPLQTTDRNLDLETIPLKIPAPERSAADRTYRLIARIRHAGDEDELPADKLHPVFYYFPVNVYKGPLHQTPHREEVEEVAIDRFARVYHSGYSGSSLWRNLKVPKKKNRKSWTPTPAPEVKLIARVKPMTKDDSKEEDQVHLNTVNFIPSTLQLDAPRPARLEGYTDAGQFHVEIRHERRAEVELETVLMLREAQSAARSHAYLSTATAYFSGPSAASSSSATTEGAATTATSHSLVLPSLITSVSEDESGLYRFSATPLHMSPQPSEKMSFLARLGFKSKKKDNKKTSSSKNGGKNETSGETSDSEHDEKREFAVVEFEPTHATKQSPPKKPEHRTAKVPSSNEPMNEVTVLVTSGNSEDRPKELKNTKEVRHETREQQFRLTGEGYTSGFNPDDPSLMATIQRAERLNASSPRLEHAERTFTVRANAPLPVSFEESGQPYTTVSTWQETSDLPEQVEVYTDENGRQITRTVKSSQVKHTVQTQSFQNYIVDGDQLPVGVVDVERSREQLTPLGQQASSSGGAAGAVGGDAAENSAGIVETQTRTMTYEAAGGAEAPPGWAEQGLGEYVSSKSVTQGNRTIETITYKTEKDGVVETHVEHRVTIHSDGDIDHDAELSQAILEATQMNPDMVVEKIEVRQETTQ